MNGNSPNKTLLAAAIATALSATAAAPANAYPVEFSWTGYFTMLDAAGKVLHNPDYQNNAFGGDRTDISGTLTLNTATGTGLATINPFYFFGGAASMVVPQSSLQAIGDGMGGSGTLVLGNMAFDWGGANTIPASIVFDATGLLMTMASTPLTFGQTIAGVGTYGASEGINMGNRAMGLLPVSTTTRNTTTIPGTTLGSFPSGSLPLLADTALVTNYDGNPTLAGYQNACAVDAVPDTKGTQTGWQCALGVGGSPMSTAPFQGFNINIDIASLTVTNVIPAVPVPPAAWLLGSGLLGLIGLSRRRKA